MFDDTDAVDSIGFTVAERQLSLASEPERDAAGAWQQESPCSTKVTATCGVNIRARDLVPQARDGKREKGHAAPHIHDMGRNRGRRHPGARPQMPVRIWVLPDSTPGVQRIPRPLITWSSEAVLVPQELSLVRLENIQHLSPFRCLKVRDRCKAAPVKQRRGSRSSLQQNARDAERPRRPNPAST